MTKRQIKIKEQEVFHIELRHDESSSCWEAAIKDKQQQSKVLKGTQPRKPGLVLDLNAAIQALRSLPPKSKVTFYTNTRYLADINLQKIQNWRSQNWKDRQGNVVPHAEDWIQLYITYGNHDIEWKRRKNL